MALGNGARRWRERRWVTVIAVVACVVLLGWNYIGPGDEGGQGINPALIARVIERELLAREAMGEGAAGRAMGWWTGVLGDQEMVEAIGAYERAAAAWVGGNMAREDAGFWDDLSMAVAAWGLGEAEQAERLAEYVRRYPGWERMPAFGVVAAAEGASREVWREIWVRELRAFDGRRDMLPGDQLGGQWPVVSGGQRGCERLGWRRA